jgi:hypothetical protein
MFRFSFIEVTAAAAFAAALPAMGADTPMADASFVNEEQKVLALEDEWLNAEIMRDEATLRRVIDDRYAVNHSNGTTTGKETAIARILESKLISATITERTILVDGDTAITFGTVNAVDPAEGTDTETSAWRYTLTYVKREGQWRALAFHISERDPM